MVINDQTILNETNISLPMINTDYYLLLHVKIFLKFINLAELNFCHL